MSLLPLLSPSFPIIEVFLMRSGSKVRGVDAAGMVYQSGASVQDEHSIGNGSPVRHFPGHSVRRQLAPVVLERTVSPTVGAAGPEPAFARLVNPSPEALFEGAVASSTGATFAAILAALGATRKRARGECSATVTTGTLNRGKLQTHRRVPPGVPFPRPVTSRRGGFAYFHFSMSDEDRERVAAAVWQAAKVAA